MSDSAQYRTALEPFRAPLRPASVPWLQLCEQRGLAFITVRGQLAADDIRQAYASLGLFPPPALGMTQAGECRLLWLSPNECLLLCPLAAQEHWLTRLRAAFAGCFAAVVDTSGTFSCVELHGSDAATCLAKVCHYDFSGRNFPVGKVVTSVIKGIPCQFIRMEQGVIRVLMRYSFAHYLYRLLTHAAAEFQNPGRQ
ncbi:sarcosine oxidase subunit gamma [Pseudogulbenkiania sp. MAI-1]|uniref:sarcosine oxidase subunit gamma n=1 Tax=Pseudogulbenkiania sp. MAI-1 TaxID=990370 RepID=UPI00045E79CA|nr:sarcosine oxidase subunit gamma family protein [Pseudogulbenkiania sp. MAI-1]